MLYVVRARHVSPKGPPYTRSHVIVAPIISVAVRNAGIVPPAGARLSVRTSGMASVPEVIYGGSGAPLPVSLDPGAVIVHILGIPGGVYVDVPYKCTMDQLLGTVIPDKLRRLGVHPHDVNGVLMCGGRGAWAADIWCDRGPPAMLIWFKLGVRVQYELPEAVVAGIVALQRQWRDWWHDAPVLLD